MVRQKLLDVKLSPSPSNVSPAGYHCAWLTFDIMVLLVRWANMSGDGLFLLHLLSWTCCPWPSLVPLLWVPRQTPIVRSHRGLLVTAASVAVTHQGAASSYLDTQVVQARVPFLQSLTVNAQPIYFSSLAVPHGMWDLAPGPGRVPMLNHWTTRDVPAIYLFLKILNFCKNLLHTGLLKMRYPVTKPRVRFHLKQSDNGSKLGVLKPQASPWVYDTCLCQWGISGDTELIGYIWIDIVLLFSH